MNHNGTTSTTKSKECTGRFVLVNPPLILRSPLPFLYFVVPVVPSW